MPGDSKKDKKKNDPKDQRKPRQGRNQRNNEEKSEDVKPSTKVSVPQKPPVYQDPGPEFYKNLKRETDEIVKITEEENSKYRKKEIQSNWAKYEMPIESYEDIEEDDAGADYEKLIQAPLSVGGHFKFKHEKSWEADTGPSLYDKYFDISMQNLYVAISTSPFYERNNLDKSMFSETDMLNMNVRANKYKHKYFNDKKYATPETEMQEKICNTLRESLSDSLEKREDISEDLEDTVLIENVNIKLECNDDPTESFSQLSVNNVDRTTSETKQSDQISNNIEPILQNVSEATNDVTFSIATKVIEKLDTDKEPIQNNSAILEPVSTPIENKTEPSKTVPTSGASQANPVIESPEDLEKWLDDFLDG